MYRPRVDAALESAGHIPAPLIFSVNARDMEDGNLVWTAPPRFSMGYGDVRHLPTVLLENHSLKPYRQRVLGTYIFIEASLRALADGHEALAEAVAADRSRRPAELPLYFEVGDPGPGTMTHRGIRSEIVPSEITGTDVVRWTGEPYEAEIPVVGMFKPAAITNRPAYYYIPASWSNIASRMMAHGIELERVNETRSVYATMYRVPDAKLEPDVFEGHVRVVPGELIVEERDLELRPGSYIVSTDQDLGDLVMVLLEPLSPDSYFQWGFFLEILQQTEYVEAYVMEPMARAMMAEDPDLKASFEKRLEEDEAFRDSPQERLQWFYEQTPFFDQEYRLYPIARSFRSSE